MGEYDKDYTLKEYFENEEGYRFERVYSQGIGRVIEIWVDKKTGVNYIDSYYASISGASITSLSGFTPLLDREGKPVISPIVGE